MYLSYKSCKYILIKSKGRLYPLIAGSVGPYGACLHDGSEYTGNYIDIYPPEVI